MDAAIRGARELAWPVVAMTTTLIAVYLPIGFQGGMTGVLFTEFAFTPVSYTHLDVYKRQRVVTVGLLKLRNGAEVTIDNLSLIHI